MVRVPVRSLGHSAEVGSRVRQDVQMLPHGVRVEIENRANGLERVEPVRFVGEKPPLRLKEESSANGVRRKAVLLEAIKRVVKDGDHETLLRGLLAQNSEVLRR